MVSGGGLRHLRSYGLLTAALAVFSVSLVLSFHNVQEQQETILKISRETRWNAFQADYELHACCARWTPTRSATATSTARRSSSASTSSGAGCRSWWRARTAS